MSAPGTPESGAASPRGGDRGGVLPHGTPDGTPQGSPSPSPRRLGPAASPAGGTPRRIALPPTPGSATPLRPGSARGQGLSQQRAGPRSSVRVAATPDDRGDDDGDADMEPRRRDDDDDAGVAQVTQSAGATIWGTTIQLESSMDDFSAFLLKFQTQRDMEAGGIAAPYYLRALKAASRSSQGRKDVSLLHINCRHLHTHSKVLYKQLVRYPQEIIPMMETIAAEQLKSMRAEDFGDEEDDEAEAEGASRPRKTKVQVMPFNLRELHDVRDLDPENIDQLVSISGMVTRTSSVVPDLKSAHYRCVVCSGSQVVEIDRGAVDEPSKCARSNCGAKGAMELVHNRCIFGDKQIIRLQEAPSSIPEGETPHTTTIFGFDDLVDAVRPGDRVECTGIFRAIPKRVNPRITAVRSVYRTYIDAIHFRVRGDEGAEQAGDDAGPDAESEGNTAAREKLEAIKRFAQQGDTYARLSKALAPSIYGMEDVKRGVLCMLFGGVARERSYEEAPQRPAPGDAPAPGAAGRRTTGASNPGGRTRGDINVLLCGDPGTSKSQLLSYVHKLAPRGVYASGKGSSAVGLTASVTRDPETRELVMESGAVVLSDLGVCCIDEFDKMSEATRAVLHEAMEQQTISLAKAGIVATLNARASILASANPKASRYDPKLSVVENIQLPPTLLSRFDLIYLILDAADADADRRLAKHIVGLYHQNVQLPKTDVDEAFVRDYIAYARAKVMPELGDEARTELIEAYVKMRGGSGRRRNARTITATPRQLEGLIRIAESLARMRLETVVTKSDVSEAVRLMQVATLAAATDSSTGLIDMDAIATGRSAVDREALQHLTTELRSLIDQQPRSVPIPVAELRERMQAQSDVELDQAEFGRALDLLASDDVVVLNARAHTVMRR